jgi:hypothetical protein
MIKAKLEVLENEHVKQLKVDGVLKLCPFSDEAICGNWCPLLTVSNVSDVDKNLFKGMDTKILLSCGGTPVRYFFKNDDDTEKDNDETH